MVGLAVVTNAVRLAFPNQVDRLSESLRGPDMPGAKTPSRRHKPR